jgi:hypothetical protein
MSTLVAPIAPPSPGWLTGAAAARLLDVDKRAVARIADRGLISVRSLPVRARYSAADVEAIAAAAVRPAATAAPRLALT